MLTFPKENNLKLPMYTEQRTTRVLVPPPKLSVAATTLSTDEDAKLWHARAMHLGGRILHHLGVNVKDLPSCDTCLQTKGRRMKPYIRMGEIGTVGIWSPKTRSVPEFVHWAVHGPRAPSCPGRRAKKIGSFFLQNFEFVNLVSAHLASAVRSAKKSKAPANISVGKETSMDLPKVRGPISKTYRRH